MSNNSEAQQYVGQRLRQALAQGLLYFDPGLHRLAFQRGQWMREYWMTHH
ncbi:MAG: hypothetical protein ACK443_05865 [Methylococcaceae bacterium]|jgi:hypothetical protein